MNVDGKLKSELLSLTNVQKEMQELINELVVENNFLTETITTNKLGKITTERRTLLEQMQTIQKSSDLELKEAQSIRSQYEQALRDVEVLKKELSDKKANLEIYIKTEAENQISKRVKELEYEKEKHKKQLSEHIHENDIKLSNQIKTYKHKCSKWIVISLLSIIIAIVSIYINFM